MTEKTILDDPRWAKLSKKRQSKLLDEHRYSEVDYKWWDCEYDYFKKTVAPAAGIHVDEIEFSLSHSQGDGAWFSGHVDDWYIVLRDLGLLLKAHTYLPHDQWSFKSTLHHRGGMSFDADMPADENSHDEDDDPIRYAVFELHNADQSVIDSIEAGVRAAFESLASDLYKSLDGEYDYLTDDETIVERLLNNMTDEELADEEEDEESFS